MKTITVATFNSVMEAEPLRSRLQAAGLQAEIRSESKLHTMLDFSRPSAGVSVEVPRGDFDTALRLIYDWNGAGKPDQPWIIRDIERQQDPEYRPTSPVSGPA